MSIYIYISQLHPAVVHALYAPFEDSIETDKWNIKISYA